MSKKTKKNATFQGAGDNKVILRARPENGAVDVIVQFPKRPRRPERQVESEPLGRGAFFIGHADAHHHFQLMDVNARFAVERFGHSLGASEETIFSKQGWPRNPSQSGLRRSFP